MKANPTSDEYLEARLAMVDAVVRQNELVDEAVIRALATVPRHRFVDASRIDRAYELTHLPIDGGLSISHPGIVAYMIQKLRLNETSVVLDIGGGNGYHAAVLSRCARRVIAVEIIPEMIARGERLMEELGYDNVTFHRSDGRLGWAGDAPYDAINVACCAEQVPLELVRQLKVGGRIILPVGPNDAPSGLNPQRLVLVEKTREAFEIGGVRHAPYLNTYDLIPVHFVPMVKP